MTALLLMTVIHLLNECHTISPSLSKNKGCTSSILLLHINVRVLYNEAVKPAVR